MFFPILKTKQYETTIKVNGDLKQQVPTIFLKKEQIGLTFKIYYSTFKNYHDEN